MSMLSQPEGSAYTGVERRRHRVFVTQNSEYHCRDAICVAVRDLRTRSFVPQHVAIGKRLSSGIRFGVQGGIESISNPGDPHVGEQMCFTAGLMNHESEVLTSPVRAIVRPPKEIVALYPN
jgi:hypothetical protein